MTDKSRDGVELSDLSGEPQLFPTISHGGAGEESGSSSSGGPNLDFIDPPFVHSQQNVGQSLEDASVVMITNDGASSICIDDYDADYQNAVNVLRSNNPTTSRLDRTSSARLISDFDAYNQRVAREVVLREKVHRRQQRQQRAKYFQNSRMYSNYFSTNPAGNDTFTPSHTYDNFNGRRQNPNYNHQLNKLNTPFTYEGRHMGVIDENVAEASASAAVHPDDDASFITLDVDALESEDDDEESLLDNPDGGTKYIPKLKRRLYSRHLQLMSLGTAFGVGVLLSSGQSFFMSGPLGTLLGYIITGIVVMCTMFSFGEMVALVPSESGIPGIGSRFVDDSLGFSLGVCYWLSCAMALPSEITAGAIMLTYYPELTFPTRSITVWITFFLIIVLIVNLFDAGMFGEIQFVFGFISILLMTMLMIYMFALNSGAFDDNNEGLGRLGFRYWQYSKSDFENNLIFGAFRPVFPLHMSTGDNGTINVEGIGGNVGRLIQVWYAICKAAFSYIGTEVVFMTAGEVRNPRKSVPAATKKIFFRIVFFYILAIFSVSINVFAGDPRLVNLSSKVSSDAISGTVADNGLGGCVTGHVSWGYNMAGSNSSPWIIAIQSVGQCAFAAGINSTFVFFALTASVSHLYSASRTLYGLAAQGLIWKFFGKCSFAGLPYVSILTSFAFGMLAYLTANHTSAQVFDWLVALTTSAGLLVWAGICFSFIRFYKGLKLRDDIVSRSDKVLYPFKSPFQPYTAYFALVMNCLIALLIGLPLFLQGQWDVRDFFTNYISVLVCLLCYVVHKLYTKCELVPLDQLDLDTGRKEMDRAGWREDRIYSKSWFERLKNYVVGFGNVVKLLIAKAVHLVKRR